MIDTTLIGALTAAAVVLVLCLLLLARRRQSKALRSEMEQASTGQASQDQTGSQAQSQAQAAQASPQASPQAGQASGEASGAASVSTKATGAESAEAIADTMRAAALETTGPTPDEGAADREGLSPAPQAEGTQPDLPQASTAEPAETTKQGSTPQPAPGHATNQVEPAAPSAPASNADVQADAPTVPPPSAEKAQSAATAAPSTMPPSSGIDAQARAYKKGLKGTRSGFIARLAKLFKGKTVVDTAVLDELEEILITADVGVRTSDRILSAIRSQMEGNALEDDDAIWKLLRAEGENILSVDAPPLNLDEHRPSLILVAGVNGVGKTTTIGKLASKYMAEGRRVLLAAGDTYRAAAVLQLEVWGQRVGCPVIKGKEGADPGAVIFDAITRAREERYDLVIADTAGRLHTKQPLMEELRKVERTITKALGGRPADEILLVLDATTGQNAVQQVHMFKEALPVSGVVLTKLDGTAKGGVILGIVDEHKIPVRFIGLGERVEDLREFDVQGFVAALFERPSGETLAA